MPSPLAQHIHCQNCSISQLCLPYSLDSQSLTQLDDIIERNKPLQKGDQLFASGKRLQCLYAVRSGSLKSYTLSGEGDQQVIGFHLPGDLIGFDGLAKQQHQSFAVALETSMLCEIPYEQLQRLSMQLPALQQQVMRLMSSELVADQRLHGLLNQKTAEQRLAAFLLSLSERFASRGLSAREFRLSMTRADIGNYLGLSVETVSRLLSLLQRQQIIVVDNKWVTIADPQALRTTAKELAGCEA